jgi:hypothetical protein
MKRHAFDPTSFVAGIVLGAVALAYLVAERTSWDVDGRWVLPVALIGLGVAGIAGALTGLRRTAEPDVTPPASDQPEVAAGDARPARPPE